MGWELLPHSDQASYEVIVVDDGSPDGTQDVAFQLATVYGKEKIVSPPATVSVLLCREPRVQQQQHSHWNIVCCCVTPSDRNIVCYRALAGPAPSRKEAWTRWALLSSILSLGKFSCRWGGVQQLFAWSSRVCVCVCVSVCLCLYLSVCLCPCVCECVVSILVLSCGCVWGFPSSFFSVRVTVSGWVLLFVGVPLL